MNVACAGAPATYTDDCATKPVPFKSIVKFVPLAEIKASDEIVGGAGITLTVRDDDTDGSATLVQEIVSVPGFEGALNTPESEIVPAAEFPPAMPLTDQMTVAGWSPEVVTENVADCWV